MPLPAGMYGRTVVPSPTYYLMGHAAPANATAASLAPLGTDMEVWVDELLQTGDVSSGHTPWTTVIVQWAHGAAPVPPWWASAVGLGLLPLEGGGAYRVPIPKACLITTLSPAVPPHALH